MQNIIRLSLIVFLTAFGTPQLAMADKTELISASELVDLLRSDNLWCYNYHTSCGWIEKLDGVTGNGIQWWARRAENDNQDVTVRFIKISQIENLLCDVEITNTQDFSLHFYPSKNYEWQAANKVEGLVDNSPGYVQEALNNHNAQLDCYGYKQRGFSHKGYPQYEQIIYIGGPNGKQNPNSDLLVLIPRLQMHGVTLTP